MPLTEQENPTSSTVARSASPRCWNAICQLDIRATDPCTVFPSTDHAWKPGRQGWGSCSRLSSPGTSHPMGPGARLWLVGSWPQRSGDRQVPAGKGRRHTVSKGTPSPVVSTRFPSSRSPQAAVPTPGTHASACPSPPALLLPWTLPPTQAVPQAWLSLDPTWGRPCRQGLRKLWQGRCFSDSHSQPVRKRGRECEVSGGGRQRYRGGCING